MTVCLEAAGFGTGISVPWVTTGVGEGGDITNDEDRKVDGEMEKPRIKL